MRISTALSAAAALGTLFVLFVPRWSTPQPGTQLGYRASSMIQWAVSEPRALAKNAPPATGTFGVDAAALADPRPVSEAYGNVQVVKDGTAGQFMALQVALTNWVAPQQGCAFCHAGADPAHLDYAADTPRKTVARTMLTMTRTLNASWSNHVAPSGVTCFTCHRGQNVPASVWYPRQSHPPRPFVARQEDWHEAASTVHDFFPDASAEEYLLQDTPAKSQAYVALAGSKAGPDIGPATFPVIFRMYEVMMQMADDIGVNCGFCHNSRAFFDWGQSTPNRWASLDGIHMTQSINRDVLLPLATSFPQTLEVVGQGQPPIIPAKDANPQPGNALANCGTCHYGSPKPLGGVDLVRDFPALTGPRP